MDEKKREVRINNNVFIVTSCFSESENSLSAKDIYGKLIEDQVVRTGQQMQR